MIIKLDITGVFIALVTVKVLVITLPKRQSKVIGVLPLIVKVELVNNGIGSWCI